MRVLVACEYSGRVRDAFRRRGHDAMSCDLLPTEVDGPHYQGPVEDVLHDGWDLMVAHPPCTDLAISGCAHFAKKYADGRVDRALDFVRLLMAAPIDRWCIENPVSLISSRICKPNQIIQPWEFGHGECKATCFWLKNLPRLKPTKHVPGREERILAMGPSPDRWKERSRTFEGVAEAMGDQWGGRELPACAEQLDLLAAIAIR